MPADFKQFYVHEQYDLFLPTRRISHPAPNVAGVETRTAEAVQSGRINARGGAEATGEFAAVARQAGFKPTLIEMDPDCCAFLRDHLHHEVIQSDDPAQQLARRGRSTSFASGRRSSTSLCSGCSSRGQHACCDRAGFSSSSTPQSQLLADTPHGTLLAASRHHPASLPHFPQMVSTSPVRPGGFA